MPPVAGVVSNALAAIRIAVVGANQRDFAVFIRRHDFRVRNAIAFHDDHVARLGVGQRHRLPALAAQRDIQLAHGVGVLACRQQAVFLQYRRDEIGAADVVGHIGIYRQRAAALEFGGVAAFKALGDGCRVGAFPVACWCGRGSALRALRTAKLRDRKSVV